MAGNERDDEDEYVTTDTAQNETCCVCLEDLGVDFACCRAVGGEAHRMCTVCCRMLEQVGRNGLRRMSNNPFRRRNERARCPICRGSQRSFRRVRRTSSGHLAATYGESGNELESGSEPDFSPASTQNRPDGDPDSSDAELFSLPPPPPSLLAGGDGSAHLAMTLPPMPTLSTLSASSTEMTDFEVLVRVSVDGSCLALANDRQRDDEHIAAAAVAENGWAMMFVSERLTASRSLALLAVANVGGVLCHLRHFAGDREVVLAAVSNEGRALVFAAEELRGDEEIVCAAVRNDGEALCMASPELRDNERVVSAAVSTRGGALRFASDRLRDDVTIARLAAAQDGASLQYATERARTLLTGSVS